MCRTEKPAGLEVCQSFQPFFVLLKCMGLSDNESLLFTLHSSRIAQPSRLFVSSSTNHIVFCFFLLEVLVVHLIILAGPLLASSLCCLKSSKHPKLPGRGFNQGQCLSHNSFLEHCLSHNLFLVTWTMKTFGFSMKRLHLSQKNYYINVKKMYLIYQMNLISYLLCGIQ